MQREVASFLDLETSTVTDTVTPLYVGQGSVPVCHRGEVLVAEHCCRVGLSRPAILLFAFMVINAEGNLHVFPGPRDFNGYEHCHARLWQTGIVLRADTMEKYVLLRPPGASCWMLSGLLTSLGKCGSDPQLTRRGPERCWKKQQGWRSWETFRTCASVVSWCVKHTEQGKKATGKELRT